MRLNKDALQKCDRRGRGAIDVIDADGGLDETDGLLARIQIEELCEPGGIPKELFHLGQMVRFRAMRPELLSQVHPGVGMRPG